MEMTYPKDSAVSDTRNYHREFLTKVVTSIKEAAESGLPSVEIAGNGRQIDILINMLEESGYTIEFFPKLALEQSITVRWCTR